MIINNRYELKEVDDGWQVRNIRGSWAGVFDTFGSAWTFIIQRLFQRSEIRNA